MSQCTYTLCQNIYKHRLEHNTKSFTSYSTRKMVGFNTIYRKAFLLCSVLVSREKCRSVLGLSGNEERDSDVIDIYVNYDDLTSLDIDYSEENTDYSLDVVSSKMPLCIFVVKINIS